MLNRSQLNSKDVLAQCTQIPMKLVLHYLLNMLNIYGHNDRKCITTYSFLRKESTADTSYEINMVFHGDVLCIHKISFSARSHIPKSNVDRVDYLSHYLGI